MNSISEQYEKFLESIKTCNIEIAKLNFVFDYFNILDKYGLKSIHWACLTSNIEILDWMLKEKCDIETSSRNGWRPIHFASFIGNEELMQYLIDNSCKLDCKTDNEETVLDVSKGNCNHKFIDEILNESLDLKVGLSMGLKCGVNCDHEVCLRFLIQAKYLKKINKAAKLKDSLSNRMVMFKKINRNVYEKYESNKYILPKLNEILADLDHPKIIKYYGLIKKERKIILFKEWNKLGSLKSKIKENGPLNNSTIYRYCKDILQAISFLHHNKILHRFIYPINIFIDNHARCKLALSDYSYSLADGDVQIDDEWLNIYNHYSFAAPELVKNGILSYPYDIWFMGCTMIEMATGKDLEYQSIKFEDIDKMISEIRNEMLQSFIRSMVKKNPVERAKANELLGHEFMRNQSIFDNYLFDRTYSIDIIQNEINNIQINNQ